jgi:CRP/FNR family transcriptional regulator, anaerobic regulatory protein
MLEQPGYTMSATVSSSFADSTHIPLHQPPQPHQGRNGIALLPATCSACHLRQLCLPCGMAGPDVERLDSLMFSRRSIRAGQTLYRQGDAFKFIFASRGGMFKSAMALNDGREQVSGFHMAGEQVGLDGVATGHHGTTATALEDTEVCAIPYAGLADKMAGSAGTLNLLGRLMSQQIVQEHSLMLLLGSMSADERLAAFLLNMGGRLKARGYSSSEFHLRMTRAEIGSHLGMTIETVSRTFSSFQKQGLLEVDKRHIRILDMQGLRRVFESNMQ